MYKKKKNGSIVIQGTSHNQAQQTSKRKKKGCGCGKHYVKRP